MTDQSTARKGLLFAFEGIDGCGKSTQAKRLYNWLLDKNIPAVFSFEPTDEMYGKALRDSFTSPQRLSQKEELELFRLDRKQHVEELIQPGLRDGKVVILDRYYYSSIAYQSVRGQFTPGEIHELMSSFAPVPDLMLLFEIDVESAINRISKSRGDIPNLMEKRQNLEAVKANFDSMDYPEIIRLDAELDKESNFKKVLEVTFPLINRVV